MTLEVAMPPGPIPKHTSQRRNMRKREGYEQAPTAAVVRKPRADKDWHPTAKGWYNSLAKSGQSQFYEPSDWFTAHFLASEMSRCLYDEKPNAALVGAIMSESRDLLTTEGQRRRMRLELLRDAHVADPAVKARNDVADIIRLAVASS